MRLPPSTECILIRLFASPQLNGILNLTGGHGQTFMNTPLSHSSNDEPAFRRFSAEFTSLSKNRDARSSFIALYRELLNARSKPLEEFEEIQTINMDALRKFEIKISTRSFAYYTIARDARAI